MNRYVLLPAALAAMLLLTACSGVPAKSEAPAPVSSPPAAVTAQKEMSAPASAAKPHAETAPAQKETPRILIAYFTRAENTVPFDASRFDADAVSSASLLPPGNVRRLAEAIQKETGGTLFAIRTAAPYPAEYDAAIARAADEATRDARPALAANVENFAGYDIIFLGYPNWDYGAPMAVRTFLESHDFAGKTVISFCAHGTGGLSSSVRQIQSSLPESARVETPLGISRNDMPRAESLVHEWLGPLLEKF